MTIQQALKKAAAKFKAQNISSADLDAEVLLLEALNRVKIYAGDIRECRLRVCDNKKTLTKSWLYTNNNYILNKKEEKLFDGFIRQRIKHKPVAYIINRKEFYGYNFYVDKNVLIPRPETEIIIDEVLNIINKKKYFKNKISLIDIGTGSGCIVISILNKLIENKKDKVVHNVYANDISAKAIKVAKINAKKYGLNGKIKFVKDDLGNFFGKKSICDLNKLIITANLPYIKKDDYKNLSDDVKKYEPRIALVADKDGLAYIKKLICSISEMKNKNKRKIYVLIEADPGQIDEIMAIISQKSVKANAGIIQDFSQKERVVLIKIL